MAPRGQEDGHGRRQGSAGAGRCAVPFHSTGHGGTGRGLALRAGSSGHGGRLARAKREGGDLAVPLALPRGRVRGAHRRAVVTDNAVLRQPTVPVTMTWTFRPLLRLATGLLLLCLAACAVHPAQDRRGDLHATLAVLATSDLHGHVLGYDYYRLREDPSGGLDRIATLVAQARARYRNTLLVDNGDTLQGSPLADWQARVQPPDCSGRLAIHEAMDRLGYDAGTLGNHEFNYGLPFLSRVTGVPFNGDDPGCRGPNFPLVLSNL